MIFSKQKLAIQTLAITVFVSIVFQIIDTQRPETTAGIRSAVHAAMSPIYSVAEKMRFGQEKIKLGITSKDELERENKALKAKLAQANIYLQKHAELSAENTHLRGLLEYPKPVDGRVEVTSVIGIDNNPLRQILVLNRGKKHGVYVGQTVLDESGIRGQIINVYGGTSRAMLLSDGDHSVAVKVQRTGVRAVISGNGDSGALDLNYVPNTADLQVGDKIVTSGLGQRFPKGYVVGVVSYIDRLKKHEFIKAKVKPSAKLSADNYVMLLFPSKKVHLDLPAPLLEQDTPKDQKASKGKAPIVADNKADHASNTKNTKDKKAEQKNNAEQSSSEQKKPNSSSNQSTNNN